MKYKISIIIPVYKVDLEYLKKCLDSVNGQTYKNYECFIICDGVEETTKKFILKYTDKKKKFKVIVKENSGVSDTRNIGIKSTTGDYITFLDADDWLEKDALATFIEVSNTNADFYICKTNIIKNGIKKKYKIDKEYNHIIGKKEKIELFQSVYGTKKGGYHWIESVWAKFYRKELLEKKQIEFNKKLKIGEDLLFNIDVWSNTSNGMFINKEIYNYRINENSVMNSDYENLLKNYKDLNPKLTKKISKLAPTYQKNYEAFFFKELRKFFFNYEYKSIKDFYILVNDSNIEAFIKNLSVFALKPMDCIIAFSIKKRITPILKVIKKLYNKKHN